MNTERFQRITEKYPKLRLAIVGDFCLDRYFDIDPARQEISIETGLPVHNIARVRCQPGAAGTILNNLVALGVGEIYPVGFCGEDGEGFELWRSLETRTGVRLGHFVRTGERRTFTYTKPLVCAPGKTPVELNRLDIKNWTPTPETVQRKILGALSELASKIDAMILMDQVDIPETGVVTTPLLGVIREIAREHPQLPIVADSRRGLRGFPPVIFKMNGVELAVLTGTAPMTDLETIQQITRKLSFSLGRAVVVTLAERGIVGATPQGEVSHVAALPLRGEIDIVGAGDSVTANIATALAGGASLTEALQLANYAASIVIHEVGTTGTASVAQIHSLLRTKSDLFTA